MKEGTREAVLAEKDVISPTKGRYVERYVWILEEKTLVPIGVRVERELSA